MPTQARQSLYAGLDLHKRNVYCGLIDQEGQPVYRRRLPADLSMILQALHPYRPQLKAIAVESTFNWYLVGRRLAGGQPSRALGQPGTDGGVQRVETDRRRNLRAAGGLVISGTFSVSPAESLAGFRWHTGH